MNKILTDFSPATLVRAIEGHNFAYWFPYGQTAGAKLHDTPESFWYATGIPELLFNGILRADLATDGIDTTIDEILTEFKSRRLPMIWWVGPATRPADLGKYLEAHGLSHLFDLLGMAIDLRAIDESLAAPPGLTIVPVADRETLRQWVDVACSGYDIPASLRDAVFDLEVNLGLDQNLPRHRYLGRLHGKPVATSLLFLTSDVAGIYFVATISDARRQGIGTAMTLAPLREAGTTGYRVGILHASPMGVNVYRRIGFQEYCKIGLYIWTGETSHNDEVGQ